MAGLKTANIVFFSGTGGTARVARCLRDAFMRQGVAVTFSELLNKPVQLQKADLLAVLYPVYAANAPQPIGEWIAAAPEGRGTPTVVVSVSGGGEVSPNTACRVGVIRALERRGYPVVYEAMAVMPSNFLMPFGDELSALLLAKAPVFTERVAREVLAGQTRRTRPLRMDRLLRHLFLLEHIGSRMFGRHLRADDRCTGCGLCAAHCPRGNITMAGGKPVYGGKCVFCLRCVYGCPAHAIVPGFGKFAILKTGFDLAAVEKRMAGRTDFPPVEELTKGTAMNGVRAYLKAQE